MSEWECFKRKSTRKAAIEAAKRIKKNASANVSLSHINKEEYDFYEAKTTTKINTNATYSLSAIVAKRDGGGDDNTQRRKGRKTKLDQVVDPRLSPSEAREMHGLSDKIPKFFKSNPPKCEDMPKRRRGRPPKSQSVKCPSTWNKGIKYKDSLFRQGEEVDHEFNLRRESYYISLAKNEPIAPSIFSNANQLQPGNKGISYKESLTNFSNDLGPTAQRVASRMLSSRALNNLARPWREPLLPSPHPCLLDVDSTNGSFKNTKTNQVTQPLISFERNYKGIKIMVDDGKKWDLGNNFNFIFGNKKYGVEIREGFQENVSLTKRANSSEDLDILKSFINGVINERTPKNLTQCHVGNRKINNQIGSVFSNYNMNFKQFFHKNDGVEDVDQEKVDFDQERTSIPPPLEFYLPSVQPSQEWYLSSSKAKNPVVEDAFIQEEELKLPLSSYMQMMNQEPNIIV